MPGTVRLHRVLSAPPARVFKAFTDAEAMVKWLPPNGFTGKVHSIDAKVGGKYRMSFTNFSSGKSHSFGGEYLEIVPGEKLRYVDRFRREGDAWRIARRTCVYEWSRTDEVATTPFPDGFARGGFFPSDPVHGPSPDAPDRTGGDEGSSR